MIQVEPKPLILADPSDTGELVKYLERNSIKWRPDPKVSWTENLIEFAGRLCYESWEQEDGTFNNKNLGRIREGNELYIGNILNVGHGSVLEHGGPLTILFENVSRVFTHELVRHRAGTAFSQTSGRYVRCDNIKFWIPPMIDSNEEAREVVLESIAHMEESQALLESIFDINNIKDFKTKKILSSDFRKIAPNGQGNNIIMSCNHRAMRHMIAMRNSEHAEIEIQYVFRDLASQLKTKFPSIYQDMELTETGEWKFKNCKV